jgi:DNA integrity scanning protein DisA with diadenylate cyclase activity
LRKAEVEEIAQVPGVGEKMARGIKEGLGRK